MNKKYEFSSEIIPTEKILDITVAGDSFSAEYLSARLINKNIEESIKSGHKLASIIIQHRGAIIPLEAMTQFKH